MYVTFRLESQEEIIYETWMEGRIILKQTREREAQIKCKQLGVRPKEGYL
jgi:hypothetical protein